jgi:diacylglycerol kinase family enzyme
VRDLAVRIAVQCGVALDVRWVEGPHHGTELAREAVAAGCERVVSVGGDGTNNAVACGLLGTRTALGVVAMGSGNGYARSLGLPLKPEAALRHAFTAPARPMDIGRLNGRPFLGTAGIGFDACVAARFDASSTRGMFRYALIIVRDILGAPPMRVVVKANRDTVEEHVLMLVFCNTREFGNGADISPRSVPHDGIAELRVVRKPSFPELVKAFIDVYTHRADRNPHIRTIPCTEATVWQEGSLAHLDGEPVEIGHEVRFKLERNALYVVA